MGFSNMGKMPMPRLAPGRNALGKRDGMRNRANDKPKTLHGARWLSRQGENERTLHDSRETPR